MRSGRDLPCVRLQGAAGQNGGAFCIRAEGQRKNQNENQWASRRESNDSPCGRCRQTHHAAVGRVGGRTKEPEPPEDDRAAAAGRRRERNTHI